MGYGHQRAAYPLKDLANERIFTANNDRVISLKEQNIWSRAKNFYDIISRMSELPLIGKSLFGFYDQLQYISPIFPFRDLSKPTFQVLYIKRLIKKGLCKSLLHYIRKEDLPIITTHFIPALAAEHFGVKKSRIRIISGEKSRNKIIEINP